MIKSGVSTKHAFRGIGIAAIAAATVAAPLVFAAPISAVISDCVITQGVDFTDRATLQTALSTNTCPGPTMFANFTNGFAMDGTELTWADSLDLTFIGTGSSPASLNARGSSRILNSSSNGLITIQNMIIEGGAAASLGAGIVTNGDVTLTGSVVRDNVAAGTGGGDGGGGISATNITVTDSTIAMNQTAGGSGGAGLLGLDVTLTRSTVRNNVNLSTGAGGGGGVASYGEFTATDSLIADNVATGTGGGGVLGNNVELIGTRLLDNSATNGGGISAGSSGGTDGITLSSSTVSGNLASNGGGGVFSPSGPVVITNSTISDNRSLAADSGGGGVYGFQPITVTKSTVSGNIAGGRGGGLRSSAGLTVVNSTVTGNSSLRAGGGLYGNASAWVVKFSTIVNNSAAETGANLNDNSGAASFASTGSVYSNSDGADSCSGVSSVATGAYNATLSGDTSCGLTGNGNISKTWASLKLGALAVNGSSNGTLTMMPGASSSLNAVVPTSTGQAAIGPNATDQRGVVRTGKFTIGAAQQKNAQTLVSCGAPPASPRGIAKKGWTRLATAGCRTSAGQPVTITGRAVKRGDVRYFRIVRRANGSAFIQTYGYSLRLRIMWSAPATGNYLAYSKSLPYVT